MIFSDADILRDLYRLFPSDAHPHNNTIDAETQIQPASIDLRLGNRLMKPGAAAFEFEEYWLQPGSEHFILAETMEYVRMPIDLVGRVDGRSSLGRAGLRIHSTAGFIDPGFEGIITLEIDLVGMKPLKLVPGMRVCQVSFHTMLSPAHRPYGSPQRKSKYQFSTAVTDSKLKEDA